MLNGKIITGSNFFPLSSRTEAGAEGIILAAPRDLTIMTPVFDDWQAFKELVKRIDSVELQDSWKVSILAVNDGSLTELGPPGECFRTLRHIERMDILHLARNLGHQRAIAVALAYAAQHLTLDALVVMDSDGEDRPDDIHLLAQKNVENPGKIIFARRVQRSERIGFCFFYRIYKILYRVLTGSSISFGNFCLIPSGPLKKLVYVSEIWNHFAAGVVRSRLPILTVPTRRDRRIEGRSSMDFHSLFIHGLSAIAVHMELVAVRLLLVTLGLIFLAVLGWGVVLGIKILTDWAIPGWATNVSLGLGIIFLQAFLVSLFLVFLILTARSQRLFVPQADYAPYVLRLEKIFPR